MKIIIYIIFLMGICLVGCTKKNFVSVPDSYNDQGRELIYASERVKGKHYCGTFLKFSPDIDFQAAIDNAIEKGQNQFGEEYVALADIIAWYEKTNYIVYSTYSAKVTGFPARFANDNFYSTDFSQGNYPMIFNDKPVYYQSSTGKKNNFNDFKYTIKNINK